MNHSGDAAEQIVRLSLEGFEVAARLTGSGAKNIALLLAAALRQEQQTKGKARLSSMIKSGKELKVFSIPQRDLKVFTKQAKRYGVLYCVLRDKNTKSDNAEVDIFVRAEDASKIQRIVERFKIGSVEEKAEIISQAQKDAKSRQEKTEEIPEKSKSEMMMEEAVQKPIQKEGQSQPNPISAETEKSPLSRQNSETEMLSEQGVVKSLEKKPSVREKINRYKEMAKEQKESERSELQKDKVKKTPIKNGHTVHKQPNKKSKSKER